MQEAGWWRSAIDFVRDNEAFIELALFVFAFAESIIVASAFVPSTLIFITIGALEGAADGPLVPLVLAGALGALAGDLASFALGYRFRGDLRRAWPLSRHPRLLARGRRFMATWGIAAIVVSKLTGPMRPLIPMLAGASRMSHARFVAASAISSLAWALLTLAPAYLGFRALAAT